MIPSGMTYGLNTEERTLPQALKDAGYRTVMIGRSGTWGTPTRSLPKQRGFDYFYGAVLGEIDYFTHSAHGVRDWYRNNEPVDEQGLCDPAARQGRGCPNHGTRPEHTVVHASPLPHRIRLSRHRRGHREKQAHYGPDSTHLCHDDLGHG